MSTAARNVTLRRTTCPHDCPSTCALEVEVSDGRIGKVRGAKANTYTDGVICAKVARYAERAHHPDRLTRPLIRRGAKGEGAHPENWAPIGWDEALDITAERFRDAAGRHGAETVWPYFYAGTMGLVQRDSIQRLRHAMGWSHQFDTICVNMAWTGFAAGTGKLMGPDPREMGVSDCVVIWGTNAVATQVNVMTHAVKARKTRGAKLVAVDVYMNETMRQADLALLVRPGTDAALACAVMHCLFRDGAADRDYMARHAGGAAELEAHLASRTPRWAAAITGLAVEEIEAFAALLAERPRSYFRLGYGFTRSRNGAVAMHAAQSIATVLGAWAHEGGGAFHSNSDIFGLDTSLIKGAADHDPSVRALDQSQIGRVLTGDAQALRGGPPVTAMLVQNTNPANVAPEQRLVLEGLARNDLFLVVHEQFMTETAAMADIVLPATMFTEHDDVYRGGGHSHILFGPKLVDAPGECRENLHVVEALARRLGVADRPGFGLSAREHIERLLRASDRGTLADLEREGWIDVQPPFREAHYLDGFGWPDGRFRFAPDWANVPWGRPPASIGLQGPQADMPALPDQWDVSETDRPFRLTTSPARTFLNSTFSETPASRKREGRPSVMMHPDDAASLHVEEGDLVALANGRGEVRLHLKLFDGLRPGTLVAEGLHPNAAHEGGRGINTLTGADPVAPHGGAAFHDVAVSVRRVDPAPAGDG